MNSFMHSQFSKHFFSSLWICLCEVIDLGEGYNLQLEGFWRFSATQTSVMKDFEDFWPSQPSIMNGFEGFRQHKLQLWRIFDLPNLQSWMILKVYDFLNLQSWRVLILYPSSPIILWRLIFEGFGFFNFKTVRFLNNVRTTPYSVILGWHN